MANLSVSFSSDSTTFWCAHATLQPNRRKKYNHQTRISFDIILFKCLGKRFTKKNIAEHIVPNALQSVREIRNGIILLYYVCLCVMRALIGHHRTLFLYHNICLFDSYIIIMTFIRVRQSDVAATRAGHRAIYLYTLRGGKSAFCMRRTSIIRLHNCTRGYDNKRCSKSTVKYVKK